MVPGVLCVGEVLIDFLGEGGATLVDAVTFRPAPGGASANAAVAAARAGAVTAFAGRVGRDAFGDRLRQTLEAAGVDCSPLVADPSAATTLAFVVPAGQGAHGFQFCRGADARLQVEDLPAALFAGCRAVAGGGVSLSAPLSRQATLHALRAARAASALAVFDVNWRPALWPDAAEACAAFREAIALADVVKCNDAELDLLCGSEGGVAERAAALLGRGTAGPFAVVVTLGHEGAVWVDRGGAVVHPGYRVDAVDAIGAGDCFTGTLLAWWVARGRALPSSAVEVAPPAAEEVPGLLARCNAGAALSTLRPGAMGAMPSRAEVDAFLREQPC